MSEHERAVMLAQAGSCSHGGHGWDGEECGDIPVAEVQRCGYRIPCETGPCGCVIELVNGTWRHEYRAVDRDHRAVRA